MSARSSNPLSPPDGYDMFSQLYLKRVSANNNKSKNKAKLSKIIGNLEYNTAKRVNKVYQVPENNNRLSGSSNTLTPTQRAIHAKILRNPGGGSHSAIVGRAQNQMSFSGVANARNKKKLTPQRQQHLGAFQERQNGFSSERKESLPPIMTPSNIEFNQTAQQQQRSSSLGRQINSGQTQQSFVYYQQGSGSARRIYSTAQNQLNLSKATASTKQSLSFSSKNAGPLRNTSLNQYINESKLRNSKRNNNNNSNLSSSHNKHIGSTTISNPYQASINSATALKSNDRMITSQRFQQKFQKRIQEKKSKNQGNNKKKKIQFLHNNFNNNTMTLEQRRDLSAGNRGNSKTLNGMMVMLNQQHQNQAPDNLNLGAFQSNRSFRIQRMNNNSSISPRDTSVESDLSIKSITLGGRLQNSINRRLVGGKNSKKIQKLIMEPKPPQRARDQSVDSSRSYRASRSFRAESIHSERDENQGDTKPKKNEVITLEQNVLIDGQSSMQSSSLAKIEQIEQLNKRATRAENLAGKYKSQLDKARQVLRVFKQKLNKTNTQSINKKTKLQNQIQKLEKKQENQRPSSASNIYNNITIYANNSVNNSISINSSANQENSKEPTTIEQLKKALKAKDQLLKKTTKALQSAKQKQQVLLKQILELNKEKAKMKNLKLES